MRQIVNLMLNPKEFRIGNYCRDKKTGAILIVDEITGKNGKYDLWFYVVDRNKYPLPDGWEAESIPIDEEILVQLGAKFIVDALCFILNNRPIKCIGNNQYVDLLSQTVIQSLHHLQNLHFALTQKELILKL